MSAIWQLSGGKADISSDVKLPSAGPLQLELFLVLERLVPRGLLDLLDQGGEGPTRERVDRVVHVRPELRAAVVRFEEPIGSRLVNSRRCSRRRLGSDAGGGDRATAQEMPAERALRAFLG